MQQIQRLNLLQISSGIIVKLYLEKKNDTLPQKEFVQAATEAILANYFDGLDLFFMFYPRQREVIDRVLFSDREYPEAFMDHVGPFIFHSFS